MRHILCLGVQLIGWGNATNETYISLYSWMKIGFKHNQINGSMQNQSQLNRTKVAKMFN